MVNLGDRPEKDFLRDSIKKINEEKKGLDLESR